MAQTLEPSRSASKSRSRGLVWFVRILVVLVAIPVVLAVIGASYQALATAAGQRAYPAPGRLFNAGGY